MASGYDSAHLNYFYGGATRNYRKEKFQPRGQTFSDNMSVPDNAVVGWELQQLQTPNGQLMRSPTHQTDTMYKYNRGLQRESMCAFKG